MLYNRGWVLDLSEQDKRTMNLKNQYNFGYTDLKKAYFGVPASGPLRMFVPYNNDNDDDEKKISDNIILANEKFQSIIVCEIKQIKTHTTCDMKRDVEFIVGDQKAEKVNYISAMGTTSMGQKLCVNVSIPKTARLTTKLKMITEIADNNGKNNNKNKNKNNSFRHLKKGKDDVDNKEIGVSLTIRVVEDVVTWKGGPCTISHVVWEQHKPITEN